MNICLLGSNEEELIALKNLINGTSLASGVDVINLEKSEDFSLDSSMLEYDVFFLDMESLGYKGENLARSIWNANNRANIIMIVSEAVNGMDLFSAHISGIIRKPITWERIQYELSDLRYPLAQ